MVMILHSAITRTRKVILTCSYCCSELFILDILNIRLAQCQNPCLSDLYLLVRARDNGLALPWDSLRFLGVRDWILRWLVLFLRAKSTLPKHSVISGAN